MRRLSRKRNIRYFAFVLPGFLGLLVFYVLPFVNVWADALLTTGRRFAGPVHFIRIFHNEAFIRAISNSVLLAFFGTFFSLPLALGYSLFVCIFSKNRQLFLLSCATLPAAIPPACTALLIQSWFPAYHELGISGMILLLLWKYTGFSVILLFSALQAIPRETKEAAVLDGAGRLRLLIHIILPYLAPAMIFSGLIAFMNSFRIFREVFMLYGEHPTPQFYLLSHYINNKLLTMDYSSISAAAVSVVSVMIILMLLLIHTERRTGKDLE